MPRSRQLLRLAREKLTPEEWEALHLRIQTDYTATVAEHCRRAGVSTARYYKLFPAKRTRGGQIDDTQHRPDGPEVS